MTEYFPGIKRIKYEGPDTKNPLAFKYYNAKQKVMGKTMAEHLRFAVCYWHSFRFMGQDMFGLPTMNRRYASASDPMLEAEQTMEAAFEFFTKLGVNYWCFHDADVCPGADTLVETNQRLDRIAALAEKLQKDTGVQLLWGTCNLFSHRRFMAGASTSPNPEVFAFAAAKVKKAMEITHMLGGQGYTFWGGREGYETLLNTSMKRELEQLATFLHMAVDYKKKLRFKGQFYIEPKPHEPTKHQYDFDAASCFAFLQQAGLVDHLKLNIEANHATLARHSFLHELAYAIDVGIFGSVDANRGDDLLGWDTDQFPTNVYDTTLAMYLIIQGGGFKTGGLNFDAKLRRQSTDPEDLFHAHIGGMDAFARGLLNAARLIKDKTLSDFIKERYSGWDRKLGKQILQRKVGFRELEEYALSHGEPTVPSGRQEYLENLLNGYL